MSPSGYKQTFSSLPEPVCFTPVSGHQNLDVRFSPDYVCLTPRNGLKWPWRGMTACDLERTLTTLGA